MANLPHASRRAALLASAAGMVIAGTSWDAIAQNVTYTNSTAIPAQPTTVFPLLNGDTLINNATGSISILSTATGFQPVVSTTTLGVGLIQNAGTIASAQNPGGIAIGVNTLSSLSTINNQATGTIAANGTNGTAIQVLGSVTSLLNSGFVSATGAGGIGGSVGTAGTIGTLTNNVGGTIASTGSTGLAIANAGTISTLSNSGLIQASGMVALNVDGGGGIGLLTNTSTGTIAANSASASGIAIGTTGTGTVATLSNAGLIQATGTNGGGIYIAVNGSVGVLTNAASGTISGNFSGASLYGAVGTMTNSGLIQATGTAGAGIYIDTSGTRVVSIVNLSGGTIAGNIGLYVYRGTVGSVTNTGLIRGVKTGVNLLTLTEITRLTNTSGGTIVATADHGTGIGNAGTIGTLSNSGLIQANGSYGTGIGIGGGGTIGLLTNTSTGSIVANGTDGIGISVGEFSTGRAGTLSNSGLVQATGTYGLGILVGTSGSVGTLINNAGGTIAADDAAISNLGTIGTVTNSGLVQGVTAGVRVRAGGTVTVLTNASTGTIAANGYYGAGVAIGTSGTGSVGTLSNAGLIQATGIYGGGIYIDRGGNVGAITNAASGTIVATDSGVSVYGSLGTLTNAGLIQGTGTDSAGVYVDTTVASIARITNLSGGTIAGNIAVWVKTGSVGSLANSGLIQGAQVGVNLRSGGTVTTLTNNVGGTIAATATEGTAIGNAGRIDTLTNSGLVRANSANGIGVSVGGGGSIGTLTNNATGTIAANGNFGIAIDAGAAGVGSIGTLINAGQIQATGTNGVAITVDPSASVGSMTNSSGGTISADRSAITVKGTLGTSTNSGVIQGVTAGVSVTSTGTFSVLTNTATGLIQGGPADGSGTAIDNAASARAMTIANAGTIIGAIKQGTGADVLNVTGGSITGAIVGQTGSGGQVNFNLGSGGSFVTGGSITNVPTVNVNSGMLTVAALSGNAISGASLFRIASGATATLNGNVGATLTSNSGFVNVGTNAISVSGNFTQASTGQLGVSVAGSTFGSLNVGGTANIASTGTGIALHFLSSSTLTSLAVLTSGGIAVSPTQTVSSDSTDPWLQNAIASTVGNNLVVTFAAPSANQIDTAYNTIVAPTTAPLAGSALNNQNQAINGVRQLLDSLSGNRQAGQALLNVLSTLTPRQLSQFFQQVQPSMLGSAQSLIATALNNSGGLTASVGDRVTALRENGGMAAGDEPGRGFSVWATPTIKGFTQGQKEGISGFTATSYGAAFGADTLVRPDTRVGLSVGLTQTDVSFSGPLSGNRNTALTAQAGVYGTWFQNNFFIDGAAGFGYSWYNTKENISGFGATRNGDFGGVQFNAKIAAGYDWRVMGAIVTPSIAFQEVHLDIDPHATHGGGVFDLNVAGQHIDVAQMKLGSRFAYPIAQSSGWTFTPELHGYYVRNLVTTRIVTSASFLAGGSFTSTSPARDTDVANLGLGLTIAQKGPFALSAVYDYSFGQTTKDNTFYLRAKTEF